MQKDELLQQLRTSLATGAISPGEIRRLLSAETSDSARLGNVAKMLYIIGSVIVVAGLGFFLSLIWSGLGISGRITLSLGLGLVLSLAASRLMRQDQRRSVANVMHAIAGILIVWGTVVVLQEVTMDAAADRMIAFALLASYFVWLARKQRSSILTFFALVGATYAIYEALTATLVSSAAATSIATDLRRALLVLFGCSFLWLAHLWRGTWNGNLRKTLQFFSSIFVLSPLFFYVAFDNNAFWEVSFPAVIVFMQLAAIRLRSTVMLVMQTLFLVGYMVYLTQEYFEDSASWPIMLILLGLLVIGAGYWIVTMDRRFKKQEPSKA